MHEIIWLKTQLENSFLNGVYKFEGLQDDVFLIF